MSNEESNSLYKCTVCEYHELHKWDAGGTFKVNIEDEDGKVCGAELTCFRGCRDEELESEHFCDIVRQCENFVT